MSPLAADGSSLWLADRANAVHLVPVGVLGGAWLLAHGYKEGLVREVP
jgi:hypothetical protein